MYTSGKLLSASLFALASAISGSVFAAGFQISETSVTSLGRAFAGNGVAGDSISDMFANPASLMLRGGRESELGLHLLFTSTDFENQGSNLVLSSTGTVLTSPSGGTKGSGSAVIPNVYYAADLGKDLRYGLSITSPFGLVTEYDDDWIGRYHAIKSELVTIDINAGIAYQLKDNISIGGGISVLLADSELSRAQFTGLGKPDARATIEGDDTAFGFNLGIIVGDDNGRLGIGYRSKADIEAQGSLKIPRLGVSAGARADVTLPQTAYISGFRKVSDKIDILGTIRWTGWSSFEELRIEFDNGLPDNVTPENWDNSTTYSIGMNYHIDDQWILRGGLAFDQTPVSDEFRTARIPDTDRTWVSLGGSYQAREKIRVDFGYAHIFTDDAPLNQSASLVPTSPGALVDNLNGKFTDSDADLLSVSVNIVLGY